MGSLSFPQAINMYFSNILNVTMYIQYFLFSIALVIVTLPKKIDRKALLWALLKFSILYISYVFGESLFFGLSYMTGTQSGGLLFTASFIIFPIIFIVPNTKDYVLHKTIKTSVLIASLLVTAEIGRLLAMIISLPSPDQVTFLFVLLRCLPMLFLPMIAFVLYKFNISRFKHLPRAHVMMILALSGVLCVSAIWQNALTIEENSTRWLLIFLAIIELAVLVSLYYSVYHLIDYRHRITELEVASNVNLLEKQALEIDIKNREELMKLRHDLRNQLSYTDVLLKEGKYEEAKNYIHSLIDQKDEYLSSFSCSNLFISGVVNLELTKAKIANKKIKFKVVVPPQLPFEDVDLLSLITNIVDNSLENFEPIDDQDAINVSIVTQQDYLRITSFNSVANEKLKEKATLKTTKRGKAHGYGTKIIKNIAKKYEGYATFTIEEHQFVCDCLINMNHKGMEKND